MKKIELLMAVDFDEFWIDELEGIYWQTLTTTDVVRNDGAEGFDWGYDIVQAECDAYENVSYIGADHKRYYLDSVSMIGDIAYPRTWSLEKPEKVEIIDWD